jgi:uncharacterized protein (DUF849 family)
MFQICLGIAWGQPATPEAMTYMRNLLPPDSPWFAFGISLHQFPMVAQTVLLGGHPRVGLEDNIYLEKGKLAPSNAALVEKAAIIIEILGDRVFVNTPKHLQAMSAAIKGAGVMPELEVFETGHLLLAKRFIENGFVKPPGMFQICLGISWGQPATPEALTYMRNLLPPDCTWFAFGISLHQFPMVAQTVLLGGHPRVGLEDNIYLEKGKMAPSNAALVEKAARIIEVLGDHVATSADARQILGLTAGNA